MLTHLLHYLRPYRKQFIIGPAFKLLEAKGFYFDLYNSQFTAPV